MAAAAITAGLWPRTASVLSVTRLWALATSKRGPAISDLSYAELQRYDVGRLKPGTAFMAMRAETISPVSPIPPMVARKSSVFSLGEQVNIWPSERIRRKDRT